VTSTDTVTFLKGGGEMGALIRAHDWSRSSLGPPAGWSQALRTVVRLMLNTGHPMFVFAGPEAICLYNDAYRESIGPERHPVCLGQPGRQVWEEIWSIIGPQIEQVMSGGGATWHVNALVPITRHGRREDVYWTYSYSPIDDDTAPNGIGGVLVVCSETTQQVLMTRRLATERDQLAELFAQAPAFMVLLQGPEHRIELTNPEYQKLIGHRDIIGRALAEALPETAEQGYVQLLDRVFESGVAYAATGAKYRVQRSPGAPFVDRFVDFVYQPITDVDGQVTGIFVIGSDVTDRAEAEARLQASTEQLRNAADQLREANRMKDEFLATLAHELRNPLAPMRNAVELMSVAENDTDVLRSSRQLLSRQLSQMVRLIDDLMDLSRVSRGIIELRRERLSLADALRDAIETSRPLLAQCEHQLTVTMPADDWTIEADRTRVVQIFANLLNNAAKFTPLGGRIELSVAADQDWAVVTVRDNGIGISPSMVPLVFNMFTQGDREQAPIAGGLGIGLTLVRKLAEMHGGTVDAASEGPGLGSEFTVRLPLAAASRTSAGDSPADGGRDRTAMTPLRIVVADDNVDSAESLALLLKLSGHDARTVHDGMQALALVRTFKPHAMVLDIGMPGMDGNAVVAALRADPTAANILLIAASGWGQPEDKARSREAGFDHHLVKPVEPDELLSLLAGARR
jgi:PAS domain S-box-containing protein